jgi:hypothetical protein
MRYHFRTLLWDCRCLKRQPHIKLLYKYLLLQSLLRGASDHGNSSASGLSSCCILGWSTLCILGADRKEITVFYISVTFRTNLFTRKPD